MRRFGRGLPFGLVVLLVGLSAIIGFEISGRSTQQAELSARPVVPTRAPAARAAEPPNQHNAWFQEIVARPLFSPNRRPIENNARTLSGLPRLAGIVVTESRRIAIFAGPSGGHPIVAEAGSRVGAYAVQDVADSGVTVIGPEGTTVVRPVFDPNQKAPTASRTQPPAGLAAPARTGR